MLPERADPATDQAAETREEAGLFQAAFAIVYGMLPCSLSALLNPFEGRGGLHADLLVSVVQGFLQG